MNRILVLDSNSQTLQTVMDALQAGGYAPIPLEDPSLLAQHLTADALVCSAERFPEIMANRSLPVILIDPQPDVARAVRCMKAGATDYLAVPVSDEALLAAVREALSERPADWLSKLPMIGSSPPMRTLTDAIAKVAPTDSPVLITGESGTGKELVARALHAGSNRRLAPLISLNCATVPADQIETELFGVDGSEPGGLLQAAAGGTLFLDEVAELPAAAQARLLNVLEAGHDVRLICASHQDLGVLVSNNRFRGDLYYRLKVISLHVPPLKDRGDDVVLLAEEILARTTNRLGKPALRFSDSTVDDMRRYPWPGNVRELENAIQRAVLLCDDGVISTEMLAIDPPTGKKEEALSAQIPDQTIEDYFVSFVTAHQDHMTETELAAKLGISRKSLWERRQRLNIPRKRTTKRGRRRDVT